MRRPVSFALLSAVMLVVLVGIPAVAQQPEACVRTAMPYEGISGASLVATDHVSKDDQPVRCMVVASRRLSRS